MGSIFSTDHSDDETHSKASHQQHHDQHNHPHQQDSRPLFSTKNIFSTGKRVTKTDIYAEIIPSPGQSLPSAVPPIKVIINQHVANTAIDSIQDSQQAANQLAKELVINLLTSPTIPNQFGTFLNNTFAYEQILHPTRDLLYWSLRFPHVHEHLYTQSRTGLNWWLANYGQGTFYPIAAEWLIHPTTRKTVIVPIIQTSLNDPVNVMQPIAVLLSEVIPYAKDTTVDGIKYFVSETLKSDDTKKQVKDSIVYYLRKVTDDKIKDLSATDSSAIILPDTQTTTATDTS